VETGPDAGLPPAPALPWQLWVDAQLPPALARWLRETAGVDARHVAEVGVLTAADRDIFDAARAAGVTAVITEDEDFMRLLEAYGPPPRVVWVTAGNLRNAELRELVAAAWPRVAELLAVGYPPIEVSQRRDPSAAI
jgi:predicted nuclease of predicted toxin-antitoxin system